MTTHETNRDRNQDKLPEYVVIGQENLTTPAEKIKFIIQKLKWSWSILAKNIYNSLQEEYSNAEEERKAIKQFCARLQKAVNRQSNKCRLHADKNYSIQEYWYYICQLEEVKNLVQITSNTNTHYKEAEQIYSQYKPEIEEFNLKMISIDGFSYSKQITQYAPPCFYFAFNIHNEGHTLYYDSFEGNDIPDFIKQVEELEFPFLQTWLGNYFYYAQNDGIPQVKQAKEWYEKASSQGDAIAQYQLGVIHEYEKGLQDISRAFNYYKASAKQEFPLALVKVALFYYYGYDGSVKNEQEFFKHIKKAADLDEPLGIILCSYAYEKGLGIDKDINKSISYYKKITNIEKNNTAAVITNYYSELKLALLYRQQQNFKESNKHFEQFKKQFIEQIETWLDTDDTATTEFSFLLDSMLLNIKKIEQLLQAIHQENVSKTFPMNKFHRTMFSLDSDLI